MNVRYYLRYPEKVKGKDQPKRRAGNKRAIYALVNYSGYSLKYYIGESINPKHWNETTQCARNAAGFPEHPEFNHRLDKIRSTINKILLTYRTDHNTDPLPAELKKLIDNALTGSPSKISFLGYLEDFVNRTKEGIRPNPGKGKGTVVPAVARGYNTTLTHLKTFSQQWHRRLNFSSIDLEFYNDFTAFLTEKPQSLSLNTVGSHIQRIKAVMAEATEKGVNKNMAFKSRYFVKQTEETDTIYLNESELADLRDLDLSHIPRLDNVRDLFLVGAYSGLRFSDFSILTPSHIKDGFIRITQVKTGQPVIIPVHPVIKAILKKRGGTLPKSYSGVKMNLYLKEIGQMVESLKAKESRTTTKGGVKRTTISEKWELITTHTARRSFATNEYLAGTPTITIMAITGHKTEKAFLKYIRVTPEGHAQKLKELWDKRIGHLRAV